MDGKTILFAENSHAFLNARKQFLEQEGYRVLTASSPEEAQAIMDHNSVDLAILDIRLTDDDDDLDHSGLQLAQEWSGRIPVIMLTGFPSWELVRDALGHEVDTLPPALDFIGKSEGSHALIVAVKFALQQPLLRENLLSSLNVSNMLDLSMHLKDLDPDVAVDRLRKSFAITAEQLSRLIMSEKQRAKLYFRSALILAILGIALLLTGVVYLVSKDMPIGLSSAISGILLESIGAVLYTRNEMAQRRVTQHINQLVNVNRVENIISITDTISPAETRELYRRKLLDKILEKEPIT